MVQQAGQHCNPAHFSAAANRMAELHELQLGRADRIRAAFQQLAQLAVNAELNSWAVAQFVRAAAKLWEGVAVKRPFGAQQGAWWHLLMTALADPDCDPQSLANGLWGASKLGWPLPSSVAPAAEAAILQLADRMKPQDVSNTLCAFANADWPLGSWAAEALLRWLAQVLRKAEPQHVADSLSAAADWACGSVTA